MSVRAINALMDNALTKSTVMNINAMDGVENSVMITSMNVQPTSVFIIHRALMVSIHTPVCVIMVTLDGSVKSIQTNVLTTTIVYMESVSIW